MAKPKNYSWY